MIFTVLPESSWKLLKTSHSFYRLDLSHSLSLFAGWLMWY